MKEIERKNYPNPNFGNSLSTPSRGSSKVYPHLWDLIGYVVVVTIVIALEKECTV